jgi:integrase
MAIPKLTTHIVETTTEEKQEDGGGLRLVVSKLGAMKWGLRSTIDGKRREMGLGNFPDILLTEARDKASEHPKLSETDFDPITVTRIEPRKTPTFTSCAARYIRAHRRGWQNAKHARQWVSTMKTYVRPIIGTKPVDAISTEDLLKILSPIWTTKTVTAKRIQGRIENILDYAAAHKFRDSTNPAMWCGNLDKLLPNPLRVKKVTHRPTMSYAEVPAFMAELTSNGSVSALALRFLILTATRTNEVLQAQWSEIDPEDAIWTIPAARMRPKIEHRVPLSESAVAVLDALPRHDSNPYLFPGTRHGLPLSNMALLQLMRGMDYGVDGNRGDYVPHGFRSSFLDWSGEVSSYPRDVAEMALARVIKNKVGVSYQCSILFNKRKQMMQSWANYLKGIRSIDNRITHFQN